MSKNANQKDRKALVVGSIVSITALRGVASLYQSSNHRALCCAASVGWRCEADLEDSLMKVAGIPGSAFRGIDCSQHTAVIPGQAGGMSGFFNSRSGANGRNQHSPVITRLGLGDAGSLCARVRVDDRSRPQAVTRWVGSERPHSTKADMTALLCVPGRTISWDGGSRACPGVCKGIQRIMK